MAMQRICNLTLAALLALSGTSELLAQEEGGRRGGGEGRSFEGRQGGEGRAQGEGRARGEGGQGGARRSADGASGGSVPARAANPVVPLPPPVEHSWLDEVADLEVQTTLLEKRDELAARRIDSQIRLKQKRTELDALERESTDEMLAYLPQVVSVMGSKDKYQCQLFFPSGRVSYARAGDQIAPGVHVRSVSPTGVEVNVEMGGLTERRQVPLNFVSLAERRGENEEDQPALTPELIRGAFGFGSVRGQGAAGGGSVGGAAAPARPPARVRTANGD